MLQSGNVLFRARNNASPCLTSYVDNIKAMSPSTASEYGRRLKSFRGVCHIDHTTGKTMSEYRTPIRNEKDLMFSVNRRNKTAGSPKFLYNTLLLAFGKTLDRMG